MIALNPAETRREQTLYVLSCGLKVSVERSTLIDSGRLFHSFRSATAKAQSFLLASPYQETAKSYFLDGLRGLQLE